MLLKVVDEEKPDAVVVAFDGPRRELKRTKEYPEYKAQRPAMPDKLRAQIEMIDHLLESMRIPTITAAGVEADDILGTLANRVAAKGDEAVVVTGDKDTLQLVDKGIRVLMTGRGITETESFDPGKVKEKYGISPEKIPDLVGLKGDSTDNIPGVPGIGEKGASLLIGQFGSLEELYENLDEISGEKESRPLRRTARSLFFRRHLRPSTQTFRSSSTRVISSSESGTRRRYSNTFRHWSSRRLPGVFSRCSVPLQVQAYLQILQNSPTRL